LKFPVFTPGQGKKKISFLSSFWTSTGLHKWIITSNHFINTPVAFSAPISMSEPRSFFPPSRSKSCAGLSHPWNLEWTPFSTNFLRFTQIRKILYFSYGTSAAFPKQIDKTASVMPYFVRQEQQQSLKGPQGTSGTVSALLIGGRVSMKMINIVEFPSSSFYWTITKRGEQKNQHKRVEVNRKL
jgi:hypothetical protein